jgi:hypothetical protein
MNEKTPPISAIDHEVLMRFYESELWEMFIALSERTLHLDVLIEREPLDDGYRGMRAVATHARAKVEDELRRSRADRSSKDESDDAWPTRARRVLLDVAFKAYLDDYNDGEHNALTFLDYVFRHLVRSHPDVMASLVRIVKARGGRLTDTLLSLEPAPKGTP